MLDALRQDVRYALRGLRSKPGFATAVIVTLALGIGANAAMFGIVDRLLFRPPAMMIDPADVHRVYVGTMVRGTERVNPPSQYARIADLTRWSSTFSRTAAFTLNDLAVGIGDAAREMKVGVVTASFFGFFDAPPVIGRYFTDAEDQPPSGAAVAVASYATWQTQFGGRKDAIGSKVQIGPLLFTIIGVSPRGFTGMWASSPPAYFVPVTTMGAVRAATLTLKTSWWKTYSWGWLNMIARRKPGVSIERASADLTQAFVKSYDAQLIEQTRSTPIALARPHAFAGSILSERGPGESSFAKVATWVSGVAVIVLLVACANVANLLLARAIRRRREIAVRLALGVSRGRLLSQLLIESVLLATLGGIGGILVAQWGGAALRAGLMPQSVAVPAFRDSRTLVFTAVVALAVGLLTGLAPVLQSGRVSLTGDLKAGAREGAHRSRMRVALLLLQAALSVVLLVGAGLFVRSLQNVQGLRLGYDAEPVAMVALNMRGVTLDSAHTVALRFRLLDRAKTIPGVEHAALQTSIPFWTSWSTGLWVEGIDTVSRLGQFNLNAVSPEFFSTLGTRIVRGRGITDADVAAAPHSMIVSEAMAKTLWPGRDAIGQCIRVNADTMPCTYVVGIAENIRDRGLSGDDPGFYYYLSQLQFSPQAGGMFVRTHGNASNYLEALRRELQREMPAPSYVTVTPFSDVVAGQTSSWRLGATMFVAFGVLALVLAAIGLYSVIAYNVAQRTHEMGVRVALGAQSADVVRLVVSQGVRLGASGVAIGAVISFGAAKWIKPLLFAESPRDPVVFAVVTVTLIAVTIVASWVPARRAARVDPNVALRTE